MKAQVLPHPAEDAALGFCQVVRYGGILRGGTAGRYLAISTGIIVLQRQMETRTERLGRTQSRLVERTVGCMWKEGMAVVINGVCSSGASLRPQCLPWGFSG